MQASSITSNIIKACSSTQKIHILKDNSQSLFDGYLSDIDNILTFPINNENEYISYDLILSNNPIAFSAKVSSFLSLHINNIIYFHSKCPNNFKKEDKFLLKNSVANCYKIFSNEALMRSWGFEIDDLCSIIPYGLKPKDQNLSKTRSVVVVNMNNNPSVDMLFNHIKSTFKDAIIVNSSYDYDSIVSHISESIVCIEAESYYNIITAIANGCSVISSIDYISEEGLLSIQSYDNILQEIYKALQSYNADHNLQNQKNILTKYSHSNFLTSFNQKIEAIRREPYIYVKTN